MTELLHKDEEVFDDPRITKLAEDGMIYKMKKNALVSCDEAVRSYIACTNEHYIAFYKCYPLRDAMNECLKPMTSVSVLNKMKKDYLKEMEANEEAGGQEE